MITLLQSLGSKIEFDKNRYVINNLNKTKNLHRII